MERPLAHRHDRHSIITTHSIIITQCCPSSKAPTATRHLTCRQGSSRSRMLAPEPRFHVRWPLPKRRTRRTSHRTHTRVEHTHTRHIRASEIATQPMNHAQQCHAPFCWFAGICKFAARAADAIHLARPHNARRARDASGDVRATPRLHPEHPRAPREASRKSSKTSSIPSRFCAVDFCFC